MHNFPPFFKEIRRVIRALRPFFLLFYKIPTRDFKEVSGIDPQHFLKNFERLYWLHKMEVLEKEDDYGKSIVVGLNFSVDHCTLLYKKLEANKPVGDFDESEVVEDFCNFDDESEDDDASAPASEENEDFEFEFLDRGTGEVGMKKKEVK